MTDKWTIGALAVAVVTAIFAILTFLIGDKILLLCFGKKRRRRSHQDPYYIKTSIFATDKLFFVQAQLRSLFGQHLPMTAMERMILKCIMNLNSSITTMCEVRNGFLTFYSRTGYS
jgi:hypothetical protein